MSATTAQRHANLKQANVVKSDRALLRRQVAAGEMSLVDVLACPPECVLSMRPAVLLAWQRRWGPDRSEAAVCSAGVFDTRPVSALTSRQRSVLSETLGGAR